MRRRPETKVLGAKSSDLLHMFKEVQWTLGSAVLGKQELPADKEGERLRKYADELERYLSDAHRDASAFVKKHRDTGLSLEEFGVGLQQLGQWEGGQVGQDFIDVGSKAGLVGAATRQNCAVFADQLEAPL